MPYRTCPVCLGSRMVKVWWIFKRTCPDCLGLGQYLVADYDYRKPGPKFSHSKISGDDAGTRIFWPLHETVDPFSTPPIHDPNVNTNLNDPFIGGGGSSGGAGASGSWSEPLAPSVWSEPSIPPDPAPSLDSYSDNNYSDSASFDSGSSDSGSSSDI